MLDADDIEAVFSAIEIRRRVGRMAGEIRDPQFWRDLNPELTISEEPIAPRTTPVPMSADEAERHARFLMREGYLQVPPIFSEERIAPLRRAVERVVARGLPSGLVYLYDEFYQLLAALEHVLMPMLGPRPLMIPDDFWVFHVPPGASRRGGFGSYGPHRDYFVDRQFLDGGRPRLLNMWIPFTDVTPLDSCMYVVPPAADAGFWSESQDVNRELIRLEDVRALPAMAGSLTAFSTRIVHWGSRSSELATAPRIALTCLLQRRDAPPFGKRTLDLDQPLTWARRLELVYRSLGWSGLEGRKYGSG